MGIFLTVVILLVCLLLAAVILVQNPKGGGLATGFQGASQFGGVQKTNDFLEKSTWYLVITLFVLCLVSASILSGQGEIEGQYQEDTTISAAPAVDGGGLEQEAPAE